MRSAPELKGLLPLLIIASLALWVTPVNAAPKTDIVNFKNGDQLTGEFKSLKRGQLNVSTDAMGTIGIEWDKVASIISNQAVQVELSSGTRYFGTLAESQDGAGTAVVTDFGPEDLDASRVIAMTPIDTGGFRGLRALDATSSLGYDFAKAGGVEHLTFGLEMDYRSLTRIESMRFSTVITDSGTQESSQRTNLVFRHTRLWSDRWFSNASLSFDQNDELGLNLRTTIGTGGGRYFVQSNSMLFSLEGELQFSRENRAEQLELQFSGEDQAEQTDVTNSLEAAFTANWDWFLFEDPELDWSTRLTVIPSLTESGRVRSELDTTLSWEIIGDLKWALSFYGSWDNQSQSATGSTSDYGVNTAVAYDF
jgi:hypothetical protein